MLNNHIGNYEELFFYHELLQDSSTSVSSGERMMKLKKGIGREGLEPVGKGHCKELITYYEAL